MEQVINLELLEQRSNRKNKFSQFLNWAKEQEENRLGWTALALMAHGAIITPLTIAMIILSGNFFPFWIVAIAAMGMTVVVNLAALPTQYTIPVFFSSLLIDIAVVISCLTFL